PEVETYSLIPWIEGVGRLICSEKENNFNDCRMILKRCSDLFQKEEIIPFVGSSLDFFLLDSLNYSELQTSNSLVVESVEANNPNSNQPYSLTTKNSLLVSSPEDKSEPIRLQIADSLEQFFNVTVEKHYHGVGIGKNTLVLGFRQPLSMADNLITAKYAAKNICILNNKICSFMPKLLKDVKGNTLRLTFSLFKKDNNLFAKNQEVAEYFLSGIVEHIKSIMAFTNPTLNSYKRIKLDKISFSIQAKNKESFINIPTFYSDKEMRIELNFPDTSVNPYLAISVILLAGLDGIKKKKKIVSFVKNKIEIEKEPEIPQTLNNALEELLIDNSYLKNAFTKEFLELYAEMKSNEIKEGISDISNSDYKKYLNI
ncbi:MAG: hypothetical protein QXO21_03445, partial [Candidatus Anstonellales archaeon]